MSLVFIVYIVGLIPKILSALGAIIAVSLGLAALLFIFLPLWWDDHKDELLPKIKRVLWIPITAVILSVVIPSEKTTYYMIAAYGTEKLIENPTAQALASDGVDVLKEMLAKAKRELTEEKPKEDKK